MSQNDVGSVPFSWLPAYGEAVEQALSASRNILETILEETSDDEDSSEIWNNSGDWETSNSGSVSNSVIEVDLTQGLMSSVSLVNDFDPHNSHPQTQKPFLNGISFAQQNGDARIQMALSTQTSYYVVPLQMVTGIVY